MTVRLTRAERREQIRADLVAAARAVFLRRGFHQASLEEIALEAGWSKGAVFSNFAGKDDLFLAVLDAQNRHRRREQLAEMRAAPTLAAALTAAGREMAGAHARDPQWTPLLVEFWIHVSPRDDLRRAVLDLHEHQLDALAELVAELGRRHGKTWRIPPREVVRGTGAMGRGLALERLLDPDTSYAETYEELFVAATLGVAE